MQKLGGQGKRGVQVSNTSSSEDLGFNRREIHEARQVRDAVKALKWYEYRLCAFVVITERVEYSSELHFMKIKECSTNDLP